MGGFLVSGNDAITLKTHEYDLLKKIADSPKVRQGADDSPLFGIVVTQQAKRMVDAATAEDA